MTPDEFRLKTGLLGFTARDLDTIFTDLHGHAADVLHGRHPVPQHVGNIVGTWWEEVITAAENTAAEAITEWNNTHQPAQLTRYAKHALLPKEIGAYASSIQAWDYHLGLILRALEKTGVSYEITTIEE